MTATLNGTPSTNARDAAAHYLGHGLVPVPVDFKGKECFRSGWQTLRREAVDLDDLFPPGRDHNVGVVTGEASGGLVDVDLDAAEAVAAAPFLLPKTGWVFGRRGKPRSHWLYQATDAPGAKTEYADLDHTMLCELRADGCQTVFPPSVHESGEPVEWHAFGELAEVRVADLAAAVGAVAAAVAVARRWPAKGSRHKASLALIGGLARAGWDAQRIETFLAAMCAAARDEDGRGRVKNVAGTVAKVEKGDPATGWPTLARLLGPDGERAVRQMRAWLGILPESDPEPWADPVPLGETPDVPPYPAEVLPGALQKLVEEIAWAMNTPPDFAGVPLLALAGGALANARWLSITSSHPQSPCLNAAYIAPPGATKSAPLKLLRRPFDVVQTRLLNEWKPAMEAWKDADPEDRGPRPRLRRCLVSDVTAESLGLILDENPRGVMMVRNELSALAAGLNQYKGGKGNDRQVYLNLWDNDPIVIDRKSDKSRDGAPLCVLDPFCGIVGNLQPDVLGQLRGEAVRGAPPPNDGFLDRFLFAYPADLPAVGERWREVSQESRDVWQAVVERLLGLRLVEEGERPRPFYVKLTGCGREAWERFTHAHAAEMNGEDFPPHLRGPWAKLRGYCGRLALILHFLRWACDEVREEHVDGESMGRAARLIDYFKAHCRKVYAAMDADPKVGAARRLVRWIARQGQETFTRRDAYRALRGADCRRVDDIDPVLAVAEGHGYIRARPTEFRAAGRKPSPVYEAHPSLLADGAGEADSVHCVHSVHGAETDPSQDDWEEIE